MTLCKDCRFWDPLKQPSCSHPAFVYSYDNYIPGPPENAALIESDEGWGWLTGPLFGCVLGEPKDAGPSQQ